ncbi:MAG: hypothetical protein H7Y88_13265 [Phycisphaerales bacterium]|nr:hypothetical protein [Phycisphaerales bacterium]
METSDQQHGRPQDAMEHDGRGGRRAGRSRARRIARSLLLIAAVVYGRWCGVVYWFQDALLFPVPSIVPAAGATRLPEGTVTLVEQSGGERVEGWVIPGKGRSTASPGTTVVFFHGNGEIIDYILPEPRYLTERGVSVLLIEYRGYGRSTGRPSQKGIVADSAAMSRSSCECRVSIRRGSCITVGRWAAGWPARWPRSGPPRQ